MKRYKLILLFIALIFVSGCKDALYDDLTGPEEGLPAEITLSLSVSDNETVTRAVSSDTEERKLYNLYVLIFDADGKRSTGQYIEFGETPERINLITRSGRNKHIYGVANIGRDMMAVTASMLDEVTDENQLKDLDAALMQQSLSRGTNFLMTGFIEKDGAIAGIDIPEGISTTPIGEIQLRRVDSKITFRITTPAGVTFIPASWRVLKLPQMVSLFPQDANRFPEATDYFTSDWKRFEGENTDWEGRTFAFYTLENKQTALKRAEGASAVEKYACREKQEKIPLPGTPVAGQPTCTNGDFVYAPANGTYVEMKGHITYKKDNIEVAADVVYTIHLGYKSGDADDYSALRNTHYIYNVTVNSVDNILLEVQEDKEVQPGAEGSVTLAGTFLTLDAHYETRCISIHKDLIDNSLTWSVKTPFSEGLASENPVDYKWILFRLNTTSKSVYKTTFQPYLNPATAMFTGNGLSDFLTKPDVLLTIDQLVKLLKECRNVPNGTLATNLFDKNNTIVFTAFIDQNYYYKDPVTGDAPIDLWKRFVNQPERIMNILSLNQYSADGESQKTEAILSFRQASIQTMYNVNYSAQNTAWGTEMIQDENIYKYEGSPSVIGSSAGTISANNPSNGLWNTLYLWKVPTNPDQKWSTYINSNNGKMQSAYNYAKYACMQQNRDNNGNGKIDKEEVQWYLASINQLVDIWIGESSFDLNARLYKKTFWDTENQWYASSTVPDRYQNGGSWGNKEYYDNPMVLWASEGSSIGSMRNASTTRLYYRCVRNLGIPDGNTTEPDDFASYDDNTGILSFDKLDRRSIREQSESNELAEHSERDADNKPWWNFQVQFGVKGSGYNWVEVRNLINKGQSPCKSLGAGWRAPNQRELALMQSRIGNDGFWTQDNHMSRTRFSFNPDGAYRHGFSVTNQAGILFLINNANERGGVRCVRDVVK